MRRIRDHLTYANVMVTILAFLVLGGGTAIAAIVVSDNSQVAPNTISGHKPPSGKHANLIAGSVNGGDIADNSLTGADIAPSALSKGRQVLSLCDPTSNTFVDCGSLTINLPRPGLRLLIVASAQWFSQSGGATRGTCRIGVNGAPFGYNVFPGQLLNNTDLNHEQTVTLTAVTDPNLGAGNHTIGLACSEGQGNIAFPLTTVSVVVLGPG
jgi:hypothetical protein